MGIRVRLSVSPIKKMTVKTLRDILSLHDDDQEVQFITVVDDPAACDHSSYYMSHRIDTIWNSKLAPLVVDIREDLFVDGFEEIEDKKSLFLFDATEVWANSHKE